VGPQGNTKWDFGQWSRDLKSKFKVSLLDQNLGEKKQYFWIALIFFVRLFKLHTLMASGLSNSM
jgi:hypothetical protein